MLSLGHVFNRHYYNNQKSKIDYETAQGYRKRRLLEFRKIALKEISARYPDAKLLVNWQFPNFMAYSRNSRSLLLGVFGDNLFPSLEFVSDTDEAEKRYSAIENFSQRVAAFDQMLQVEARGLDKGQREHVQKLMKNGHRILKSVDVDDVVRLLVTVDNELFECMDIRMYYDEEDMFRNRLSELKSDFSDSDVNKIADIGLRVDFINNGSRNYFTYQFIVYENYKIGLLEHREEFEILFSSLAEFGDTIGPDIGQELSFGDLCEIDQFSDMFWLAGGAETRLSYLT